MDVFSIIQTILVSLIIIGLIHYIYTYLIENFTETKIKDPSIVYSNYDEILNQPKKISVEKDNIQVNKAVVDNEQNTYNMNMEEELKIYLQQQMNR